MPNNPYDNFVPMQAYMNANPHGGEQAEGAAADYQAKHTGIAGYDQTGKDNMQRMQHTMSGYTPGMSALDNSLDTVQSGAGKIDKAAEGSAGGPGKKGKTPTNNEPGTPGDEPGFKAPGTPGYRKPPGKQQTGGRDDVNQGVGFDNASPFNPMIAQMQQAMMAGQPQPEPKKKADTEKGAY